MRVDFGTAIPAAQAGDKVAQDALMKGFYGWTVSYCRRIVGDPDLAADIAVAYWEWMLKGGGLQRYDGSTPVFTWLRFWLHRRVVRTLRDQHAVPMESRADFGGIAGGESPEALASAAELSDLVLAALDPEEAVIYQELLKGRKPGEIARIIGRPRKYTANAVSLLRAKAREILGDDAGRR